MSQERDNALVVWFYDLLEKHLKPEALNTLIERGFRSSRFIHGFMIILSDIHDQKQKQRKIA
jgi:hypothetical protein